MKQFLFVLEGKALDSPPQLEATQSPNSPQRAASADWPVSWQQPSLVRGEAA